MDLKSVENIKVSVIIPFRNRIPLLLESLKSVIAQTHENWEAILIDDGSEDATAMLEELADGDKRIIIIETEHIGAAAARNLGIKAATGDYIAFLDSDDLWKPKKLSRQLEYMLLNGYMASHTSYQRMDENANPGEIMHSARRTHRYPELMCCCEIATPTVMLKRELLAGVSTPFPAGYDAGEDVCLWIDVAYRTAFAGLDEVLSLVRIGGSTAALDKEKQLCGMKNVFSYVSENRIYRKESVQINELMENISILTGEMPVFFRIIRYGKKVLNIWKQDGLIITVSTICKKLRNKQY